MGGLVACFVELDNLVGTNKGNCAAITAKKIDLDPSAVFILKVAFDATNHVICYAEEGTARFMERWPGFIAAAREYFTGVKNFAATRIKNGLDAMVTAVEFSFSETENVDLGSLEVKKRFDDVRCVILEPKAIDILEINADCL